MPEVFAGGMGIVAVVTAALSMIVNVLFAIGVYRSARIDEYERVGPVLVGVFSWTLATLLGGPFVAGLYWAMNRSTLRPRADTAAGGPIR